MGRGLKNWCCRGQENSSSVLIRGRFCHLPNLAPSHTPAQLIFKLKFAVEKGRWGRLGSQERDVPGLKGRDGPRLSMEGRNTRRVALEEHGDRVRIRVSNLPKAGSTTE